MIDFEQPLSLKRTRGCSKSFLRINQMSNVGNKSAGMEALGCASISLDRGKLSLSVGRNFINYYNLLIIEFHLQLHLTLILKYKFNENERKLARLRWR